MAPFFTLFCHNPSTPEETELVKSIEKYYYVFIDSELDPSTIDRKYKESNAKFFGMDRGEWVMYDIDLIETIAPETLVDTSLKYPLVFEIIMVCCEPVVPFSQFIDASITNLGSAVFNSTSITFSQLIIDIIKKANINFFILF